MRPTKKDIEMKKLLIALAALTALSTSAAYSYTCRTQCYWVGNQYHCDQRCTEW